MHAQLFISLCAQTNIVRFRLRQLFINLNNKMSFGNASKNFTNTIKSKPPLVIFTVCVLGIIISSLSLAYYVHSNNKIANLDAKEEWLSVLKYMLALEACLYKYNESNVDYKALFGYNTPISSVMMHIKVSLPYIKNEINVKGEITLKDWTNNKCPEKDAPEVVFIEFTLPKNDQNHTRTDNVCAKITGPSNFMPKFNRNELCQPIKSKIKKWQELQVKPAYEAPRNCNGGIPLTFEYDPSYGVELKFDMFLNEEDRFLINSHLIVTSCFLVCIVIIITGYALCKNKTLSSNIDSKQLLIK